MTIAKWKKNLFKEAHYKAKIITDANHVLAHPTDSNHQRYFGDAAILTL
jgi:hypothetical protein